MKQDTLRLQLLSLSMKFPCLIILIIFLGDAYSQQASDYFPQQTGYKWNYRLTILDSLNNPIPEFNFTRMDSSAYVAEYLGKNAYHILTKTGTEETIPFIPYMDTNYVHLSGLDGYTYYKMSELKFIFSFLDSTALNNILPFLGLLELFNGWYLTYRFAHNVNQQFPIVSIDTSVTYNSTEIPLRFILNGRRLEDDNIETGIGTFLCKKFVITSSINYLIIFPPPLPPVPVPIITTNDTVWIAPDNWIVQEIIPSTNIDLTLAGLENYTIPGLKREAVSEATGIKEDVEEKFIFNLEQNYPNPFNPATRIKFNIGREGNVSLKVYNILGKELLSLINEELGSGNYEILFDGSNFSTGVYFYTLAFSGHDYEFNYITTKQMVLIK